MNLKFKIAFFNFMIFLIIFDVIYLFVWILSIQMNPVKAIIVAGIAALITPWARPSNLKSGRKVVIRSYAYALYNKYRKNKTK
jgi:hypothetical protein